MTITEGITIIIGVAGYVTAFTLAVIMVGRWIGNFIPRPKVFIGYLFVTVAIALWASVHFLGPDKLVMDEIITSANFHRPWVYRALIPILARALSFVMPLDWAIVLLVTLSGVGFYHALRKLASVFYPITNRMELYLLGSVFAGLFLFWGYFTIYDLATACLFTMGLYYIYQYDFHRFIFVFVLACLNKETAILLVLLWFIRLNGLKWRGFFHQLVYSYAPAWFYLLISMQIRLYFHDNPGSTLWLEPLQNLQRFTADPARTALHLAATLLILGFVFRGWNHKPLFLRLAFVVFAPLLFAAYIVMGQAYEVRIFWELYPVLVLLVVQYQNNEIPLPQSSG